MTDDQASNLTLEEYYKLNRTLSSMIEELLDLRGLVEEGTGV